MRDLLPMMLVAAAVGAALPAAAATDVLADAPSDLSVTVYRAPSRAQGSMRLDDLEGFALVSETRTVRLPAGESRVRFEGVADAIEPASAIVTGLPTGIVEKNRDGSLLSPSALVAAAAGKSVLLLRSNAKTGKTERVPGTLVSNAEGVVFQTRDGVEALRCSGLSESFNFETVGDLSATPTLSIQVRTPQAMTAFVTLSYLARGFDWAADYTAKLSADGRTLALGAWVTLANGNGEGFPDSQTQVIAGRLNRESEEVEPIDIGAPILAQCWPQGSTSDPPQLIQIDRASPLGFESLDGARARYAAVMAAPALMQEVMVTGAKVQSEQLGDLKLYRVPNRTTVASRQSKQVRLMDRPGIPIRRVYSANLQAASDVQAFAADLLLRTKNNKANHLGLPLPSGNIVVYATRGSTMLRVHESAIRDLAVDEEVEINMGESPDVQVRLTREKTSINPARSTLLPLLPGIVLRTARLDDVSRVEVSNARDSQIQFELRLKLFGDARVVRADHAVGTKNGQPIFRLTIPAHGTATVRYQTQHTKDSTIRQ